MDPTWIRIEYRKMGDLRFISHLDLLKVLERALRRSELPLYWREGFNPRPRIAVGAALPLGVQSQGEVMAFALAQAVELEDIERRFAAQLPRGLEIFSVSHGRDVAPTEAVSWELSFPETVPSREKLMDRLAKTGLVTDQRGREFPAAEAVQGLEPRAKKLLVTIAPVANRSLRPDILACALGLGQPQEITKQTASGPPKNYTNTGNSNVTQTIDQRIRAGRAPDCRCGEQPSPGDSHLQPEP